MTNHVFQLCGCRYAEVTSGDLTAIAYERICENHALLRIADLLRGIVKVREENDAKNPTNPEN